MDDMRRDFEAWAVIDKERERCLDKFIDGAYCDFWVEDAWQAYQAGRASKAGWRMVPAEPTEEMMAVYQVAFSSSKRFDGAEVYKTMIAAAPDQEE